MQPPTCAAYLDHIGRTLTVSRRLGRRTVLFKFVNILPHSVGLAVSSKPSVSGALSGNRSATELSCWNCLCSCFGTSTEMLHAIFLCMMTSCLILCIITTMSNNPDAFTLIRAGCSSFRRLSLVFFGYVAILVQEHDTCVDVRGVREPGTVRKQEVG